MSMIRPLTEHELYGEFRRAENFLDAGQPTSAARIVAPVVEADPDNKAAVELLARAYFASSQLRKAEATLRMLVDLCPDEPWARHALARTLERTGRMDEAAGHRRVAVALGLDA